MHCYEMERELNRRDLRGYMSFIYYSCLTIYANRHVHLLKLYTLVFIFPGKQLVDFSFTKKIEVIGANWIQGVVRPRRVHSRGGRGWDPSTPWRHQNLWTLGLSQVLPGKEQKAVNSRRNEVLSELKTDEVYSADNISLIRHISFVRCCADIVRTLCRYCADIVRTYISRDICPHIVRTISFFGFQLWWWYVL